METKKVSVCPQYLYKYSLAYHRYIESTQPHLSADHSCRSIQVQNRHAARLGRQQKVRCSATGATTKLEVLDPVISDAIGGAVA
jgi:hypothetical protein